MEKEIWLAPPPEVRSPWDGPYISKEIFVNALDLQHTGETMSDEAFLDEQDPEPEVNFEDDQKCSISVAQSEVDDPEVHIIIPETEVDNSEDGVEAEVIEAIVTNEIEVIDPKPVVSTTPAEAEDGLAEIEVDKVHKCQICSKMYKSKNTLNDHLRYVHQERKVCTICGKSFSSKRTLKQHMDEIHNKAEVYEVCSGCGKSFSRRQWLRNHENKCTGDVSNKQPQQCIINCQYCAKLFKSNFAARLHEKKKHNIEMAGGYMIVPEATSNNKR